MKRKSEPQVEDIIEWYWEKFNLFYQFNDFTTKHLRLLKWSFKLNFFFFKCKNLYKLRLGVLNKINIKNFLIIKNK